MLMISLKNTSYSMFGDYLNHNGIVFQVMLLMTSSFSYINTNHEDFIGFAK